MGKIMSFINQHDLQVDVNVNNVTKEKNQQ